MSTQYNRARSIGSIAYARQQLINLMFPNGLPAEVASASFISALSTATTATLEGFVREAVTASTLNAFTVVSNANKWNTGLPVILSNLTGFTTTATAGPTYYLYRVSATSVQLASTQALAQAGTPDITISIGTGTCTISTLAFPVIRGINNALLPNYRNIFELRYLPPTATPAGSVDKHVLIWCHGHDNTLNSTVYTAASGASYATTGANHSQRIQQYGLPNSTTLPAYATTPLLNGVGIIEVSSLGEYLNSFLNSGTYDVNSHSNAVSDLGAEMVGMFLWPIIVAVNSVIAAGMVPVIGGFSGGGWASLMAAALDPRIKMNFVHSGYTGTYGATDVGTNIAGDGEQTQPDVYAIANAHELAVMGTDGGRMAYHIWNTSVTYGDTVLGMTAADLVGLQQGGLRALAEQYGGSLNFVGFLGASDPVTNFANNQDAVYAAGIANAAYASALNGSSALGAFTYKGVGHHLMHQALHLMATQIVTNRK